MATDGGGSVSAKGLGILQGQVLGVGEAKGATTIPSRSVSMYSFRLFIAGDSIRSQQAIANLRRLGEERLGGRYDLVVVDVITDPQGAESARVLTTPTLVKESPAPARRVTGDLTDAAQVMTALGLDGDHNYRSE